MQPPGTRIQDLYLGYLNHSKQIYMNLLPDIRFFVKFIDRKEYEVLDKY